MADYVRVLEGLKRHAGGGCFDDDSDSGCPYWNDKECGEHLAEDALELLKAQEPMLVVSKDTNEIIGDCPRCGRHVIHWHNKYCAECGQAVKWE